MTIRELVTLLSFRADMAGARQYEAATDRLAAKSERMAARSQADAAATAVAWARALVAIGTTISGTVLAVARAGDIMTANLSKLEGQLGSAARAEEIYARIYGVVRETGAGITETTNAFLRYNFAVGKLGGTAEQALELVSGLQAGMTQLGLSTAETASVTQQLGQALGKGVLNDDELKSLREAMPQLVDEIRTALRMTDAEFSKAAERSELTAERIFGPLMAAAKRYQTQLSTATPTMARSWSKLLNVVQQTLADIDRQLGLSRAISAWLDRIAAALERFRRSLPDVRKAIADFGGLDHIVKVLGASLTIVLLPALLAVSRALAVILLRAAILAAPFLGMAAAVTLATTAVSLFIDDLVAFFQGRKSLIGEWLGPWAEVRKKIGGWFADLAIDLHETGNRLQAFFAKLWADIIGIFENGVLGAIGKLGMLGRAMEAFKAKVRENLGLGGGQAEPGTARPGAPAAEGSYDALGNWQGGGFQPMSFLPPPGLENRLVPAAANYNSSFSAPIVNNLTVNAPANDGASIAAAAQQGVNRATDRAVDRFGEFARALAMATPRIEAAAS